MQALLTPLHELAEFSEMQEMLKKKKCISVSGCVDSQKLHMIYGLSDGFKYKIIVTYSDLRAREIWEDYKLYDRNVMLYPAKDLIFYQADIHGNQLMKERIRCLRRILEGKPVTLITTFSGLMAPQSPLRVLEESVISISKRGTVDEAKLAAQLVAMGYEKTYQVESPGQFSIRGGIVDIFDFEGTFIPNIRTLFPKNKIRQS